MCDVFFRVLFRCVLDGQSVHSKIAMARAVYCGNFEYDARQSEIERLFDRYGRVDRVDMKTGASIVNVEAGLALSNILHHSCCLLCHTELSRDDDIFSATLEAALVSFSARSDGTT